MPRTNTHSHARRALLWRRHATRPRRYWAKTPFLKIKVAKSGYSIKLTGIRCWRVRRRIGKPSRACDGGACDGHRMETCSHCDGIPSERVGLIPRSGYHARAVPERDFPFRSRRSNFFYLLLATFAQRRNQHQSDCDADQRVGDVEAGEMVDAPMEVEHVDHKTAEKTIDYVTDDTRVKKRLRHC